MNKDKQIEEMARTMCFQRESCTAKSCTKVNCEKTWLAEKLYTAGYRKADEVARNIFGNLKILGRIDFDGNICIKKDSFDELEKIYTEDCNG